MCHLEAQFGPRSLSQMSDGSHSVAAVTLCFVPKSVPKTPSWPRDVSAAGLHPTAEMKAAPSFRMRCGATHGSSRSSECRPGQFARLAAVEPPRSVSLVQCRRLSAESRP
jgi:hypothetical protein